MRLTTGRSRRCRRHAAGVAVLLLAVAGCGIPGTSVPVDAGGAPSRVSCDAPTDGTASASATGSADATGSANGTPSASATATPTTTATATATAHGEPGGTQVTVYLVCGSALAQVERTLPPATGTSPATGTPAADPRLRTARALLEELQRTPSPAEAKAGFNSALPTDLKVTGPRPGDPADALRLNTPPDDLPPFALSQLVCTYGAHPGLGRTRGALLGGPGSDAPQRYKCGDPSAALD
ncbi:hypothetical protein ACFY12_03960 [Streptomyces sp. NPDC001339]|uniref:hypothetical protein n=1 Tax=Streptomyces sp. NPDC001339 TaxID=3364563 RepID=UPI0036BCC1AB